MNNLIVKKVIYFLNLGNVIIDNALKRLINSGVWGKTGAGLDDDITSSDLGTIDFINATYDMNITSNKVSSLEGLENAINLIGIDISGNEVSSIDELREITTLYYLEASDNKITDLQRVNRNLQNISLQRNKIKSILGISRAENINELNLAGNEIVDIRELEQLTALNKIVLTNNKIADVSVLVGFQVEDSKLEKWAALGGQYVELTPVYYEKENDNIVISLPLEGKLKDLKGNVPQVIKNIIYKDLNEEIVVSGTYNEDTKIINYEVNEIPQLVSFDFNSHTVNNLADSFNGSVISYIAMKIENDIIKKYINEKIEEAGGVEKEDVLYKDYKEKGIDRLTTIDLSNKGLTNLKNIDLFTGAENINVENNNLVDMSDLLKFSNLRNISISAINQRHRFDDSIIWGKDYTFALNTLSINEVGNNKFEVKFSINDISHSGIYESETNIIKWTNLNQDVLLTFSYIKTYKEAGNISGTAIDSLAAGEPYNNIVDNGVVTINLFVNVGRGLDLF